MLGVGQLARLAVAELPENFRFCQEGGRRDILQLHADEVLRIVGQRHATPDRVGKIGDQFLLAGLGRLGRQMRDGVRPKNRGRHRPRRRFVTAGVGFPCRHHRRRWAAGGVVVLERVLPGTELDLLAVAGKGAALGPVAAWRRDNQLTVDQQEAAIFTRSKEPIAALRGELERARVTAQKRRISQQEWIAGVLDRVDVVAADPLGTLKRLLDRFEAVQVALAVIPRFQQQPFGPRPLGDVVRFGRLPAIEHEVLSLAGVGFEGHAAEIAGAQLEHARRQRPAVGGHRQHVHAVPVDLAVVVELGHRDRGALVLRQHHAANGLEFGPRVPVSLGDGRRRCDSAQEQPGNDRQSNNSRRQDGHLLFRIAPGPPRSLGLGM